jgi:aspartate kinase
MLIQKFGGTSVGTPERMAGLETIIPAQSPVFVVLSAVSGTTDRLVKVANHLENDAIAEARMELDLIKTLHLDYAKLLLKSDNKQLAAANYIDATLEKAFESANDSPLFRLREEFLPLGELLSTFLFTCYLQEQNRPVQLLQAKDFVILNAHGEPEVESITKALLPLLEPYRTGLIYLSQGFICSDHSGETAILGRGGSDYSASLIGAALDATEIQIWTDIDGMRNNDPRIVKDTKAVRELSFDEAAELAYFGAKILHPNTIHPARVKNIPVRLKYTMDPAAPGTLISEHVVSVGIKALAAKDGITTIHIKSGRMLMAYGFLRAVFEIFERHKTSIDLITTSEVAVSLTIDNTLALQDILKELTAFGHVESDGNQTIICIVGKLSYEEKGLVALIFQSLKSIPIKMVSYGASEQNVSILVDTRHKNEALLALHAGLFES